MRRPVLAAMLAVLLILVVGCGADEGSSAPPSSAPRPTGTAPAATPYVSLGDSYAAGAGVLPVQADSPFLCQRSAINFAHLVAAQRRWPLTDVSCSGADTADLTTSQYFGIPPQLDALGPQTRLVTLMLGGNDENIFGGAIRSCGDAIADGPGVPAGSPCRDRYGSELAAPIDTTIYPALVDGLTRIRARAPNARVVIVGYPWILPPTQGCYPAMRVAPGDVPYLRGLQADLNDAVHRAAERTGVIFVDMSQVSQGHDACAGAARWIEPQEGTTARITVHPNARGHEAIAAQIVAALDR
ncbi:SGNH/GDSL hydrolase family protein [Gordonia oryzae]|uniref:SGNH/GDSL hydrolase family protein n=1 Tax=Gordonia oryzae TaxID=2487349 RepID=A0A3N4GRP8_9ACTN|nr:SGNH/GDSL hydrolase family protein [Gordonia oryzae]RPA65623.1 SGNH/GDSL hydrolase family protein [Gordonia oryzae]